MLATWGCSTFPKPTLSLDFAGATSLDDRITFTRGSQATLFDSTGTLKYAKHNLLTYSQDFADATWSARMVDATLSSNVIVAPDGTLTGDKLVEDAASGIPRFGWTQTIVASTVYTFSCFAKEDPTSAKRYFVLYANSGFTGTASYGCTFDLGAGTVTRQQGGFTGTITPVGNGWYRCTVTTSLSTGTSAGLRITMTDDGTATIPRTYTGDGYSGIFIWGVQLNLANMEGGVTSSLTTYYPTTTAAYYAPRFDYNPSTLQPLGLLIEEARTNSIRNNTMQGAVAGTPGTNPTNWAVTGAGGNITSSEIVSVTTESGINAIDYKYVFSGAATANIRQDSTTLIAASNGQTWTASAYAKLAGGTLSNCTVSIAIQQYNSGGTVLNTESQTFTPTGSGLATQRISVTKTLDQATVAYVIMRLSIVASGAADITLRIGLPQLELGAFATSVIPTTTTALTRNADVASMTGTNFSSWYNATEGTALTDFSFVGLRSVSGQRILTIDDGSSTNLIAQSASSTNGLITSITDAGSSVMSTSSPATTFSANTQYKMLIAYKANDSVAAANGTVGTADTSNTIPTVTTLRLAASSTASTSNCWFRRIAYYPTRLPDTTLQALTA